MQSSQVVISTLMKVMRFKNLTVFLLLEVKLNEKDQLLMSFESYTICEQNKNYTTEITFVCTKNVSLKNTLVA